MAQEVKREAVQTLTVREGQFLQVWQQRETRKTFIGNLAATDVQLSELGAIRTKQANCHIRDKIAVAEVQDFKKDCMLLRHKRCRL